MDGTRVLVVALLLCTAPISGIAVADTGDTGFGEPQQTAADSDRTMSVITVSNSSEYLAPSSDAIDRTDGHATGIDVAAAVEADAAALESVYLRAALERRYLNADTDAERRAVVADGVDRLTTHVDELTAAEENAIGRFNSGSIGTYELVRTLTAASRSADTTDDALQWLQSTANELGMDADAERAATQRIRLVPMQAPVRSELASAATGDGTLRVYVETAGDGLVLAAMDRSNGHYLREAHDPTAKADSVRDQYGGNPSPALDRFTELYPWTINSFDAIDALGPEQVRLYRFGSTHPHGELETYLDSGSTEILHERQLLYADAVPSTTVEQTDDGLRLVVNRTRAGGPLGISVVDATSGSPVDADIELNGDPVGSTGGDRLWTIAPRGAMMINATHDGQSIATETVFD